MHITGKDNILADTLSRLINIDPDVEQEPELKDYEFGHYAFGTLSKAKGIPVGETLASVNGVCGPELGHTSAVCVVTLLEPLGPDLIPRGHQLFVREELPSSTQA